MSPTPSIPTFLARAALATTTWLQTRAFVAPPIAWRLLATAAFGSATLLFVVEAWVPAVLTASVAAGSIQPLVMWRRVRARPTKPAIVLARFSNANPSYEELATVHIQEVERRLRNNPLLSRHCDIRLIHVPLDLDQANRILRYPQITGVLSGKGLVVANSVRWEGWGLLRSPGAWFRSVRSAGRDARIVDRQIGIDNAEHTHLQIDAEVPASSLTAEAFSADHAIAIEGLLLAHFSNWIADADPASGELRAAAEGFGPDLPLSAQALLAATRIRLQIAGDGDFRKAVSDLEQLGDGGLQHWRIWDYCFTLMLEHLEDFSADDRLRVAEKGARASPEHALAHANIGATLLVLGRRREARAPLSTALGLAAGDEPAHFYPAVMTNSFMAGGDRDDWQPGETTSSRSAGEIGAVYSPSSA
ncbi:MAG TPA: hypothetical protein VII45_00005 [Solirubrobacterales bacterium]